MECFGPYWCFVFLGPIFAGAVACGQDRVPYSLLELVWASSLYDAAGKRALLTQYLTSQVIDEVAAAAPGRFLYIGIVNLDTGEFRRVDMVRLAREIHGKSNRDDCYRAVIDASSAIPLRKGQRRSLPTRR
jgi:hypothetical protein